MTREEIEAMVLDHLRSAVMGLGHAKRIAERASPEYAAELAIVRDVLKQQLQRLAKRHGMHHAHV